MGDENRIKIFQPEDIRGWLSSCLQQLMEEKGMFDPKVHNYLTNVMAASISTTESQVYSVTNEQTNLAGGDTDGIADIVIRQERFILYKKMGETALIKISCWPETMEWQEVREYLQAGATAYESASNILNSRLMRQMAARFAAYTDVAFHTRQTVLEPPVTSASTLETLAKVLDDKTITAYIQ